MLLAALVAPPAHAQPTDLPDPWLGDMPSLSSVARWKSRPDGEQVRAAYPEGATGDGFVYLACRVQLDGDLSDCRVKQELPEGLGFGRAALSLTDRFRLDTTGYAPPPNLLGVVHFQLGFRGEGPDLAVCPAPFCIPSAPAPPPPPPPPK